MFKLPQKMLITCCFSLVLSNAWGVQVKNIYSASVEIQSQLSTQRAQGFDEALKQVIVKASGIKSLDSNTDFLATLLPAEPYVQTFSYQDNPAYTAYQLAIKHAQENAAEIKDVKPEGQTEQNKQLAEKIGSEQNSTSSLGSDSVGAIAPPPYLLDVSFASSLVQKKMIKENIPIWGNIRPSVLLWLVIEKDGERTIVGSSDQSDLLKEIENLTSQRGLPLYLPVADLEDSNNIDIDDLWGLFPETTNHASERYQPDAEVMMRMYQNAQGVWDGNWQLKLQNESFSSELYERSETEVLGSMFSFVAKKIASKYAVNESSVKNEGFIDITVNGITTFDNLIKLETYLNSLPPVARVELKTVYSDKVDLRLSLLGQLNQFFEHIELGGKLKQVKVNTLALTPIDKLNRVEQFNWTSVSK